MSQYGAYDAVLAPALVAKDRMRDALNGAKDKASFVRATNAAREAKKAADKAVGQLSRVAPTAPMAKLAYDEVCGMQSALAFAIDALGKLDLNSGSLMGGLIQSPAGPGLFVRFPFVSAGGNTTTAGQPYELLAAGVAAATDHTMNTPALSYAECELLTIEVELQQDAAAATDFITLENLVDDGGAPLFSDANPHPATIFRRGSGVPVPLRGQVVLFRQQQLTVTINVTGGTAATVASGNTVITISAVVHVHRDTEFDQDGERFRAQRIAKAKAALQQGMAGGYLYPMGVPRPGNLQRVPFEVRTAAATNATVGRRFFRLVVAGDLALDLQLPDRSFVGGHIVGLEIPRIWQSIPTDIFTVRNFSAEGGAPLFLQGGVTPSIWSDYRAADPGNANLAMMCGLRGYPPVERNSQPTLSLRAYNGLIAGAIGTGAAVGDIRIPGIFALMDANYDAQFGLAAGGPYEAIAQEALALVPA